LKIITRNFTKELELSTKNDIIVENKRESGEILWI